VAAKMLGEIEYEEAPPNPGSLIESLRSFGYSLETAIADLVDNSISAGGTKISIDFNWNDGDPIIKISDNGKGMNEDELFKAMTLGTGFTNTSRSSNDLGRFGLGLKTASFSQCRELTVITRQTGHAIPIIRRWNLDTVSDLGKWALLKSLPENLQMNEVPETQGTTVIWTLCDHFMTPGKVPTNLDRTQFVNGLEKVSVHLASTFHLFIEGRGVEKIELLLNGNVIPPWDPFLKNIDDRVLHLHSEELPFKAGIVKVSPVILPHKTRLSEGEFKTAGGRKGWVRSQGFYIYRNKRLIVQGGWLQLGFSSNEHTKLARIAVEIDCSSDYEWQIDVMKSVARPPTQIAIELARISRVTRFEAEKAYKHRGKQAQRLASGDKATIWIVKEGPAGERVYEINRNHPLIAPIASGTSVIDASILRILEETIPVTLIALGISGSIDQERKAFSSDTNEVKNLLMNAYDLLTNNMQDSQTALDLLQSIEPFSEYPELIQVLREEVV